MILTVTQVKDDRIYNTGKVELKDEDGRSFVFELFQVKELIITADKQPEVRIIRARSLIAQHNTWLKTRTDRSENSYQLRAGDIAVVSYKVDKEQEPTI